MIEQLIISSKPLDYEFENGLASDRNLNEFTHLKRLWLNPIIVQETYTPFGQVVRTALVDMYHEIMNVEAGATHRDTIFTLIGEARSDAYGTIARIWQGSTVDSLENIRHEPIHQDTQQVYCGVRTRFSIVLNQEVDCGVQVQPYVLQNYVNQNYVNP